jgi:hypothetical protein
MAIYRKIMERVLRGIGGGVGGDIGGGIGGNRKTWEQDTFSDRQTGKREEEYPAHRPPKSTQLQHYIYRNEISHFND